MIDEHEETEEDLFEGFGRVIDPKPQARGNSFPMIKETLERTGLRTNDGRNLKQVCYILHKKGQYAIMHYKELIAFDTRKYDYVLDEESVKVRNHIINLMERWKFLSIPEEEKDQIIEEGVSSKDIVIVPSAEKELWEFDRPYFIGG